MKDLPFHVILLTAEKKKSYAKKHFEFNSDGSAGVLCLFIEDSQLVDNLHPLPLGSNCSQSVINIPTSNNSFVKEVWSHPPPKSNLSSYDSDGDSICQC